MQSLPELLRNVADRHPLLPAIEYFERTIDFENFNRQSDRLAAWLARRGIARGDRVGLYCVNSDFFAIAYFGILKAGAVVVPVNLLLNPKEISYILQDAGARALIYFDAFAPAVDALRPATPCLELFLCIGGNQAAQSDALWTEAIACPDAAPAIAFEPDGDLAALNPGLTASPAGIRAYCRDNLGRHEVPRKVFFMGSLPKSAAGKILKRALRRQGELERGIDLPAGVHPA